MNLKEEIINNLKEINKSISDIDFYKIGILNVKLKYKIVTGDSKEGINLNELDIEYDAGFGTQYIYGYIVFKDTSWLEREEYDGAESWEYKQTPTRETEI